MKTIVRKLVALILLGTAGIVALAAVVFGGYYYVEPSLPDAAELRNVEFQIPLSVYTRDGRLIAQFGEQKRTPVPLSEIPQIVVRAFLAAEDKTFFEHPGVDFTGIARSAVQFIAVGGGERVPGASTITQQVARENFLSMDFSLVRKFREWIMAVRIEREFTKNEILELFLNTRFLGQRSYGVAAAARTYFNKDLQDLTISDAAILAGIPQGPSYLNPVAGPDAARDRREYVLRQMYELGWISAAERDAARTVPVESNEYGANIAVSAPYVAELVRREMVDRYGGAAYTAGMRVTATVDSRLQVASNLAIRKALEEYDRRHGYRGPIARLELPEGIADPALLRPLLTDYPSILDYETAVVTEFDESVPDAVTAIAYSPIRGFVTLDLTSVAWARPYIDDDNQGSPPVSVTDVLQIGDVIRLRQADTANSEGDAGGTVTSTIMLAQIPDVQGAFVALDPFDGAIVSLNGGYDFNLDNFNRATQALRQPGSAMKPFTMSAALENGLTVATIINDSPLTIEETEQEEAWRPENHCKCFYGDITVRYVLERSINVSTLRIARQAGIGNVANHVRKFGFSNEAAPRNAGIALGIGGVSPVELATGYAAFANGGFKVSPYFIDRIEDIDGNELFAAQPLFACADCNDVSPALTAADEPAVLLNSLTEIYPPLNRAERIISDRNAYLVTDMLQGVIRRGTGVRANRALGRSDLAGKTGTTNDGRDGWFAGFNADLVGTAWVGFNQNRPLGRGEEGSSTALPMWIAFMEQALDGVEPNILPQPPGIVEVRINPENGLRAADNNPNVIFEIFDIDHVPEREPPVFRSPDSFGDSSESSTHPSGVPIF